MSSTPTPPPPETPPPSSNPQAVVPSERIEALDAIRGVALAGVLLANLVGAFRVPVMRGYLPADPATPYWDRIAEDFVQYAIQGKAITTFSVLFGVGLAMQFERFARRGRPRYWLGRRLAALLLFGVAHLTLVWNGDILTEYALTGLLVLPLLAASNRTLFRVGLGLYGFYLVAPLLPLMPAWPDDAVLRSELADALRIYGTGTYAQIRRYSLHEWRIFTPVYVSLFSVTPALFLAGVVLWRSGVLQDPGRFQRGLRTAAATGLALGAVFTLLAQSDAPDPSTAFGVFIATGLAPVTLALGYGATLLLLLQSARVRHALRGFAAAGRMAFTNYIAQSLAFSWVFFGYGLGLVGRVGAAATLAAGVAFFALQVAWSRWWLARFHFGPLEWFWRSLTYGERPPLRKD